MSWPSLKCSTRLEVPPYGASRNTLPVCRFRHAMSRAARATSSAPCRNCFVFMRLIVSGLDRCPPPSSAPAPAPPFKPPARSRSACRRASSGRVAAGDGLDPNCFRRSPYCRGRAAQQASAAPHDGPSDPVGSRFRPTPNGPLEPLDPGQPTVLAPARRRPSRSRRDDRGPQLSLAAHLGAERPAMPFSCTKPLILPVMGDRISPRPRNIAMGAFESTSSSR